MEKLREIDYSKMYSIFKKIPLITSVIIIVASIVFGIWDEIEWITEMDSPIIMWTIVGFVAAVINWFVYSVLLSPIVIITDAKIKEQEKE